MEIQPWISKMIGGKALYPLPLYAMKCGKGYIIRLATGNLLYELNTPLYFSNFSRLELARS